MARIIAVNLDQGYAVRDDLATVPIIALYDSEGDETDDPKEAVAFTAGNAVQRFTEMLGPFVRVTVH
jgi:hypothetical protein